MSDSQNPYDETYYRTSCGPIPYDRSHPEWLASFSRLAEAIVKQLRPRRVLDVGCAKGFLVEALWDRGVQAHGTDISEVAIAAVRADIKPFCQVRSATEPIEDHYDLITCIEVLEHLSPSDARRAVASIAGATDTVLFSSTPTDISEPTHQNVRPLSSWVSMFESAGLLPDLMVDASFASPHAMLFRRASGFEPADVIHQYVQGVMRTIAIVELTGQAARLGSRVDQLEADALATNVRVLRDGLDQAEREVADVRQELQGERENHSRTQNALRGATEDATRAQASLSHIQQLAEAADAASRNAQGSLRVCDEKLRRSQREVERLEAESARKDASIHRLTAKCDYSDRLLAQMEMQYLNLVGSRPWRLTRPLRRLARAFRSATQMLARTGR